jgi:hypothetical protein
MPTALEKHFRATSNPKIVLRIPLIHSFNPNARVNFLLQYNGKETPDGRLHYRLLKSSYGSGSIELFEQPVVYCSQSYLDGFQYGLPHCTWDKSEFSSIPHGRIEEIR